MMIVNTLTEILNSIIQSGVIPLGLRMEKLQNYFDKKDQTTNCQRP